MVDCSDVKCTASLTCGDCKLSVGSPVGPTRNKERRPEIIALGGGWYKVGDRKIHGREAALKANDN
jgi:hypothetical protein